MKHSISSLLLVLFSSSLSGYANGPLDGHHEAYGAQFKAPQYLTAQPKLAPQPGVDTIRRWNQIAINASGVDHTPVPPMENRVFGEQLGPARASRAMAIIHIAMFDAINAVVDKYESYTGLQWRGRDVSVEAAIAQAAHDTLSALFPSQAPSFDTWLAEDLNAVRNPREKANGITLGRAAASAILTQRTNDGSQIPEPRLGVDYFTSNLPGHWRQDPISLIPLALGARWGQVRPFVIQSSSQFRVPPPPAITSPEYAVAYDEAKRLGGDGAITPTERTPEQSHIGVFWAYDGTPSLCAPPRLYNELVVQIADQMHSNTVELARLLALTNVAMADAAIGVWESKFHYDFWRPVTGIREADPGTGPSGLGDGNPATVGDTTASPLGAPASNLTGPNFTPPFPGYPSGHGGFGGAVFQVMREFYGRDNVNFTFVSDEFNGETRANDGTVRPYLPRHFSSFSQAEEENGQSRIYLGIHWHFDCTAGIALGRNVGNYVLAHAFRERHGHHDEAN
ncbi:MAG: vanadium-dependent haloperoxidase [Verrucomicrobiota bacterium]|nr:vanadium-dependent haloperoxidase [Verrucomicrobiota bacterium]